MSDYPSKDIKHNAIDGTYTGARIIAVTAGSPADDVGFEPGCVLISVDGHSLRDVIDWRWFAAGDDIKVGYIDCDGDHGLVELWRNPGEDWGFEFESLLFDYVRQCCNACTFCFVRQLPRGMRSSLYVRDDDFRLSFLTGTFVTLTNLCPEDEIRIIEQRISPLRVSLQASNSDVRQQLMGKHAQRGLNSLVRLLAAGIQFHAQIVLVPGCNDGRILHETLTWAYAYPGILNIGIVPLGFTRHQTVFNHSFNEPHAARDVLSTIEPFQHCALEERGHVWVFAADEFYRNAYGDNLLAHLPQAAHYGDFPLFEDGIGIIRTVVDEWEEAERKGLILACAKAARAADIVVRPISGCAQQEFLDALIIRSKNDDWLQPLYVRNTFFGGNVDVTGLLTAHDIISAIQACIHCQGTQTNGVCVSDSKWSGCLDNCHIENLHSDDQYSDGQYSSDNLHSDNYSKSDRESAESTSKETNKDSQLSKPETKKQAFMFAIPTVIFNSDALTLDDMTVQDMERETGVLLRVISCSPLDYFNEIAELLHSTE